MAATANDPVVSIGTNVFMNVNLSILLLSVLRIATNYYTITFSLTGFTLHVIILSFS